MRLTWSITALAACLFIPLFVTRGIAWIDFWWWMSANIVILLMLVAVLDKDWRTEVLGDFKNQLPFKIGFGLISAAFLYGVFYAGDIVSRQLFSFAGNGIEEVYAFKNDVSPIRITLLMALIIGPGEELFWRGFLQRRLQVEHGPWCGFVISSAIYGIVHIGSGNLMLIIAACVCGFFWGLLYLRTHSLLLNVVSHTVWDVSIFLLFPVG
jgi:hypothetical protein